METLCVLCILSILAGLYGWAVFQAFVKVKIEAEFGGSKLMGSAELSLKEHGTDAKSVLPAID